MLASREKKKPRVFENMLLRRIFGPRRDEVTREWRRLHEGYAPAALSLGKTRYPLYRRLGLTPGPVWTGSENLAPHRDSIPGLSSP